MGAKLLRGRFFDESEDTTKPRVTIVNQAMVRRYFPNEDALGKQLTFLSDSPADSPVPIEIVGLVEDIKEGPLDSTTPPVMYIPFNQAPNRGFFIAARTEQDENTVLPALTSVVRQIDPSIVIGRGASMRDLITDSQSAYIRRSSGWVAGGFAVTALLLSVIGLYGVVAYSVSQRTREIGIRMALGAEQRSVYRMVMGEAGWLTAGGILLGAAGAAAAATVMKGLLFGVTSWDLPTLGAVSLTLAVAALLASYIPARRAAAVNPVEALRAD
jgi:macrolide transport system ATP-binding/permease protein